MSELPIPLERLGSVSSTALMTLLGRAQGPLDDPEAARLAAALMPALAASEVKMHRYLATGRLPRPLRHYLCLRAAHFDDRARAFARAYDDALIVNLAAGFDTRFHRLEGRVEVIDVDLPEMIDVKRRLMDPAERYHLVAGSVTGRTWLDAVPTERPVMFLAEGLFMYLSLDDVRALVTDLGARHPGCELVAEVFQQWWLEGWRGQVVRRRLRRALRFEAGAEFQSGLQSSRDLEDWGVGTLLGEWSAVDHMAGGSLWRHVPIVRRTQWVVHYRLGEAPSDAYSSSITAP